MKQRLFVGAASDWLADKPLIVSAAAENHWEGERERET